MSDETDLIKVMTSKTDKQFLSAFAEWYANSAKRNNSLGELSISKRFEEIAEKIQT